MERPIVTLSVLNKTIKKFENIEDLWDTESCEFLHEMASMSCAICRATTILQDASRHCSICPVVGYIYECYDERGAFKSLCIALSNKRRTAAGAHLDSLLQHLYQWKRYLEWKDD